MCTTRRTISCCVKEKLQTMLGPDSSDVVRSSYVRKQLMSHHLFTTEPAHFNSVKRQALHTKKYKNSIKWNNQNCFNFGRICCVHVGPLTYSKKLIVNWFSGPLSSQTNGSVYQSRLSWSYSMSHRYLKQHAPHQHRPFLASHLKVLCSRL